MTDPNTLGAGWYIKEASVSGTPIVLIATYPEADFQVSLVRAYVQDGNVINYIVNDVTLADLTETGVKGTNVVQPDYVILVVSFISQQGFVDYQFQAKSPKK